jgi:hypothetical protein
MAVHSGDAVSETPAMTRSGFSLRQASHVGRCLLAALGALPLAVFGADDSGVVAPAAAASAPVADSTLTGERSYALPAFEIVGFDFLLNRFNRYLGTGREDYAVSLKSIRRNLRSSWDTDHDAFSTNQLGHPYQGSMYHGFARSAGFNYWESAGYAFGGSAFWEIAGEQTRPSRNDQIASGIGGTFLGESLFRMSSLVLERGGGLSPFWNEVAAAAISPATGFNRLVFRDRYGNIFSSHDANYYSRLQVGYVHSVTEEVRTPSNTFKPNEAQLDFSLDYGVPKRGYDYVRPFDYFNFQATASSANGFENVLTRGLLIGKAYDCQPYDKSACAGLDYRGVWGIYGSYDYISPQTFRVSTTALSLGTTANLWLTKKMTLEGTFTAGVGYTAVGSTHGAVGDRDYNYGVTPQALLSLRLTHQDYASFDITGREYFVSNVGSGTSGGHDNIVRVDAALTFPIPHFRKQFLTVRYLANRRDASFAGSPSGRETRSTIGIYYTLLGRDRFGEDEKAPLARQDPN